MKSIPTAQITAWTNFLPGCVAMRCGYCGKNENFRPDNWGAHGSIRFSAASCPGCRQQSYLIVLGFNGGNLKLGGGELFTHPSKNAWVQSFELSEALARNEPETKADYEKAILYFDSDDSSSVVLAARRMLEGLTAHFLKEKNKAHLASALALLTKERDLSPILDKLSSTLKDAGNIGAHRGASRVSKSIAQQALSLAEDLMELHFLLEGRVERLAADVGAAKNTPIPSVTPIVAPPDSSVSE
jgi:hypothetical protein